MQRPDENSSGEEASHPNEWHTKEESLEDQEKNHKPTVQGVRALPSAQELREIFEASELFQSNTFKLQVRVFVAQYSMLWLLGRTFGLSLCYEGIDILTLRTD